MVANANKRPNAKTIHELISCLFIKYNEKTTTLAATVEQNNNIKFLKESPKKKIIINATNVETEKRLESSNNINGRSTTPSQDNSLNNRANSSHAKNMALVSSV